MEPVATAGGPVLHPNHTTHPKDPRRHPTLGISALTIHQPAWELENAWFGDTMPRKFAHHTGIEARGISLDDELTMGLQAVRQLQRETGCNLADCRGIAFVSPSFIPASTARQHLPPADIEPAASASPAAAPSASTGSAAATAGPSLSSRVAGHRGWL